MMMDQKKIILDTVQLITTAEDHRHVKQIIENLIDDLIERNVWGIDLKLFLIEFLGELVNRIDRSGDGILNRKLLSAIVITHTAQKVLNMKVFRFELN